MSSRRLESGGTTIDRNRPLSFTWAGRKLHGVAGDTLASALLANGVSIVGRSFKYHRPRGLLAAGLEEPNGIVQFETGAMTVPNLKATQVELYEGLAAKPVNAWPSAEFDLLAVNSIIKRFIPAAFYYKTFFWPSWRFFESSIRKMAGLGAAPAAADPDSYEHRYAHVDVLVVGSGAAGLAAAESAAARHPSDRIMLVESDAEFGGGLLYTGESVDGSPAMQWRDEALGRLREMPNVQLRTRTMAFGFYDHGLVGLYERLQDHLAPEQRQGPRQRMWKVRCREVILATGAFERPMQFSGNDLPGVMLASAGATYLGRFGVVPGQRVVVCTNNDSAYSAAFAMRESGCEVSAIIDSRSVPLHLAAEASRRWIQVLGESAPFRATGGKRVRAIDVINLQDGSKRSFECDTVLCSNGWNPAVHLHSQAGGGLNFDDALQSFVPSTCPQKATSVGAAAGILDVDAAIAHAKCAGLHGRSGAVRTQAVGPTLRFADGDAAARTAWVDFQNDVTVGDVQLASRENFRSVEHLKRYTTLGMASDQGKTSNVPGIHILSTLLGKTAGAVGTTKFRPPFDPITIGAVAGRAVGEDLMPLACTPSHSLQMALGAHMEPYGTWMRASYFPRAQESEVEALAREVHAVRHSVGVFDASTLGKIEVKGPDAAEFLQRIYANDVRKLKLHHCRYALMLNEHGIVYDDGVLARIGENHYLVGTTSGHASSITDALKEWLQCEWPHLRVLVENVTTAWAVMNIAGPRAREVLGSLGTTIDLSADAFPHMTYRSGSVAGVPARIQRVSFTGELSYEVSVPWGYGASLWHALMLAGRDANITPFGVESLMVMRVEKGFLHVGSDTDGTTYPADIGFGAVVAKKPDDFIGRRSTMRAEATKSDRRQLVGLLAMDGTAPLVVGSHVVAAADGMPTRTQGWVTSSVFSPTLQQPLAMALVERGTHRLGEVVRIWDLGHSRQARIVDCRFFDPMGERLRG
jgi:sarcosine oxidase, subunit alpha